jgi:hypothetical protein
MDRHAHASPGGAGHLGGAPSQGNLVAGILAGVVGAAVGAVVWGLIAIITGTEIGWVAVGVGALVGAAVRNFGKGFTPAFGVVGAVLALLGCVGGRLLAIAVYVSGDGEISAMEFISGLNLARTAELLRLSFNHIDIVFALLAVGGGYKLSINEFVDPELARQSSPL